MMEDDQDQETHEHEKSQETTVSGEGKLLIKLKIPQVKVKEEEEEKREEKQIESTQSEKVQVQITRVCEVCNKGFSSGKALGGHMRIHVQGYKENSLKKLKTNQHQPTKYLKKKQQQQQKHDDDHHVMIDNNNNTTNGSSVISSNSIPTCSICDKKFPSMKSLFGHMRCHPERPWRGIQPRPPPPKTSPPSSSSVSDSQLDDNQITAATDLIQSLPRWSVTARRGRKALSATVSSSEDEEEELRDAVEDLMRLAQGDSLESGLTQKHVVEEFEATNSNSMTNKAEIKEKNWVSESKKRRIEANPVGYMKDYPVKKLRIEERGSTDAGNSCLMPKTMDKSKGKAVLGTGFVQESSNYGLVNTDWHQADDFDYKNFTDYESDSEGTDASLDYKCESSVIRPAMIKSKKKRKKLKLRDLESVRYISTPVDHQTQIQKQTVMSTMTTPPPDKYKCSTCNKTFPSHQALGGHRSSHNKVRNVNTTIQESLSPAGDDEGNANPIAQFDESKESEGAASSMLVLEGTHQCTICSKTFPTGQALGGHKRCHWTGPVEAPSSQVTSPGEASQTGRKVLEFDLNELPAMEFEEGLESDHAAGYCYPSSSYNSFT